MSAWQLYIIIKSLFVHPVPWKKILQTPISYLLFLWSNTMVTNAKYYGKKL